MELLRRALSDHMQTMRTVVLAGAGVDSGIYDVSQVAELLREPGRVVQLETAWIRGLLDLLHLIERYLRLVDRWTNHVAGLMQNLGATEVEISQAQRMQLTVVELFRQKRYDHELLRWILTDLSDEVDRLVAQSQDLVSETPRLVKLADQFGGPFLEQVKQIALVWMSEDHRDFYAPLINTLQEAHAAKTSDDLLQKLVSYLQQIRALVASTPMFPRDSKPAPYSRDALEASRQLVDRLAKGIEDLTTFVALRTQAYMGVLQHEEALVRAVLPPSAKVSEWIARLAVERAQPTEKILPDVLVTDTLPLAVQLAGEALAQIDGKIDAARPFFEGALLLNDLLQSPATAKFLAADDRRLEVYRELRPRITPTFSRLRTAIKSLP
jgi:hypothetical protein